MKLSEAIDLYIRRRRAVGAYLHSSEIILRSFLCHCGNVDLHKIKITAITKFLNGRRGVRPSTWLGKYGALKLFFAYWCLRGRLRRSPLPPSAPKRPQDFIPYIYSRSELQRLLEVLPHCQCRRACLISAITFRTLLLVLYGTGMRLGEALRLCVGDVDLTHDLIRIRETNFYKSRLVPIARDVHRIIEEYLSSPKRTNNPQSPLFQSNRQKQVSQPSRRGPSSDCDKCARCSVLSPLRFNLESTIFATRSQSIA